MKRPERIEKYNYFRSKINQDQELTYRKKGRVVKKGRLDGYRFVKHNITAKITRVDKNSIKMLVGGSEVISILFKDILYYSKDLEENT